MEPVTRQLLSDTFLTAAKALEPISPVAAALSGGLSEGPSPALETLYDTYFRVISAVHPNLPVLLAALHALALAGDAPALARFFPSCGGSFDPSARPALVKTAEDVLREHRESLLDFLLSHEPRDPEVRRSAAVMLGALATVERFGGGLSLVELGSRDGLALHWDRYRYSTGNRAIGAGPVTFNVQVHDPAGTAGRLLSAPMPRVVGRTGLDPDPIDLSDEAERRVSEAFIWPDQVERLTRFRAAVALQKEMGRPPIRRGVPELDLARLLVETYNQMEPGNTLFLFSLLSWNALTDEAQKRTALGLQTLAAQVQAHKPIAWLQVDRFTPGQESLELRLHTFGWADLEDRAVRRLAEASQDLARVRWLE